MVLLAGLAEEAAGAGRARARAPAIATSSGREVSGNMHTEKRRWLARLVGAFLVAGVVRSRLSAAGERSC
jgi:hypothetical protein